MAIVFGICVMEDADVEAEIVFRQQPDRIEEGRLQHEFGVHLVLDEAAHAADRLEFSDPRHLRLDCRPSLQRQTDDGAEHATVALGEAVDPIRFVEILRHVDIDLDEHQALDDIRFGRVREIVRRPVAIERGSSARPAVAETFLVEEMDVGIDDGKIDHADASDPPSR